MRTGDTRAYVVSSDGKENTFIGCNWYRLKTACFGLVVKVIGFDGTSEDVVGVFYRPISASVGAMDVAQQDLVRKRKRELEAASV